MMKEKQKRLESSGWLVGSTQSFLGLTDEEAAYIEIKLALAKTLVSKRKSVKCTQIQLAKKLQSSQSRVAKMEAGDASVTLDLIVHALLAVGCTPQELGQALER